MSPIKETRRLGFKDIIVKPDDVRSVASVIRDVAEGLKAAKSKPRQSFEVLAEDFVHYESETEEIFEKGSVLDTKQILAIDLTFSDSESNSRIKVNFTHGNHYGRYYNYFEVSGTNSTWASRANSKKRFRTLRHKHRGRENGRFL